MRFAALGDSLTAGVGDRVDGGWRGWAVLLAEALTPDGAMECAPPGCASAPAAPVEPAAPVARVEPSAVFRNFATSGALTRDVRAEQTPAALAFGPDIASVVVGVNDTLRRAFDIASIARALDEVCAALTARGTVLLTACLPDPGVMLGLPGPLARPLARRQRAVNTLVHALSARYGAVHLHAADPAWVADRSLWSADRLHPGERGHRMIAARFHAMLTERGLTLGPSPSPELERPPPTRTETLLWLATAGTGWMVRRSTDLLPELLLLAGGEMRHRARGTATRLDLRAEHALSRALTALPPTRPLARMGE
ncbi:SGNH/GDSL hydrolase family protein [Streptomyces sp. NBC_01725]|uniref:SGNH/GDSL hydrolase family protein n=1 Tax=Streptomyces sp. NBC_01725 TaxID=2975923 RepID=UPI002E2BD3B8|nr:SGNH/GDSL hydrolase family protein [Streptomyces sp. NBC_01725]